MHFEIPQEWRTLSPDRACGPCYACCVYLGIEELKKYSGRACKHLCGGNDPAKRCSIYDSRPKACVDYICLWRAGWGPDEMRPDVSGMLITIYEGRPGRATATVNIIDKTKAKNLVQKIAGELLTLPIMDEIRLIFLEEKRAILFRDGNIYRCKLLPQEGYESLIFEADLANTMGKYTVVDDPNHLAHTNPDSPNPISSLPL